MTDSGGTGQRSGLRQWGGRQLHTAVRLAVALVVVFAGLWVFERLFLGPSALEEAYDACREDHTMVFINVGDDGSSLTVDGAGASSEHLGEEYTASTFAGFACLLDELEVSDALRQDIVGTTAMMGRQSESEDGLEYRWSYHPDSGVQMTIRED